MASTEIKEAGAVAQGKSLPPGFGKVFSFLAVLAVLLIGLEFMLARKGMGDPDIWWHLRNAEFLFQNHHFPGLDTYSFTVAGQPWMNHEWLAEIPFYLAWRMKGLVGLKVLKILLLQLIFSGVLYLCWQESRNFKASFAACIFCSFLAQVAFGPRTILFGYAYLVILLIILQRFRLRGKTPLWLLPPLFCLWINTHGSWLLGMICFSIILGAGLVKVDWGLIESQPWSREQRRQLTRVWFASVAALFVNPFGFRLVLYPFDLAFRQRLNISHIAEWVSVDFHDWHGKLVMVLLLVLLMAALVQRRRWSASELLLVLFGLYCGLTYIRFLFLVAILAAPLLARIFDFLPVYKPESDASWVNAIAIALMAFGMFYYWPRASALQGSLERQFPVQAVDFLKAHPPRGHLLAFYPWGGYLEWTDRDVPVFIDGRVDIFEYAGVFQDYIDLLNIQRVDEVLNKYKIRYVLFPHDQLLTYVLERDPGWKKIYWDGTSILFERVSGSDGQSQ